MTDSILLNWAVLAVSLFNTILLIWLGLTVLFNSDRRAWGIWVGGGGLLLGGAFFVSHSAILGYGPLIYLSLGRRFWWYAAAGPAIILPFAWYIVILWYAGFWNDRTTSLYQRHHRLVWLMMAMLLVGLGSLLLLAFPHIRLLPLRNLVRIEWGGLPLLAAAYLGYITLCMGLSLDALRYPGPSDRVMGNLARQRARPWLAATSIILLLVSLMVGLALMGIILQASQRGTYVIGAGSLRRLAWFDLAISGLIGTAVLMLGQAVVAYEVFTGKTLPRRGLARHWQGAIILAAGYSLLVGGTLAIELRPIYSLLLTALLMTLLYALFSWRSYAERERFIDNLRPFLVSQRVYDKLLRPAATTPSELDVQTPFYALCQDVLGARLAYLAAVGPLAPLVGPAVAYPRGGSAGLPGLTELANRFVVPETLVAALDPEQFGGATWAIPLWSERGLIGFCLLGEKWDGAVYTQEEIEVARATGERLIDTQASAEMARRLMALQRQRLAESQVVDRRTRRILHDEVLPQLHTAMLALSRTADETAAGTVTLLSDAHRQISEVLRQMPTATTPEVSRLGLLGALQQSLDQELGHAFEVINWQFEPGAERLYEEMPLITAEVIFYAAREAIRNAARHGRSPDDNTPLTLSIGAGCRELTIEDNGRGITPTESESEGSGQGLALHGTMMAVIGGTLAVESIPGSYTRVRLTLP